MTVFPLHTFGEKVAPIVALCQRIIARYGGTPYRPQAIADIPHGHTWHTTGYLFPRPVRPSSEVDYALQLLSRLSRAQALDGDAAKKQTWDAAILLMEAVTSTTRRRHATQAAWAAATRRTARADRTSRAKAWAAEVAGRRLGFTKAAVYAHIERREGLRPGTVKKAIQRYTARRK